MAHAVVIRVKVDPDSDVGHRHSILNDYVIPEARALPGFQKGVWLNDGAGTGTCVLVFVSEPNAQSAIAPMTRDGGPQVLDVGVHLVEIEA
jgi:hypothetical protein